jgi:putative drug exporter of the RND superfamily
MFRAWGRFVCRWRWAVLPASLLLLGLSVAGVLNGGTLNARPPGQSVLESDRAQDLTTAQLGNQTGPTGSTFQLVFGSPSLGVSDPGYQSALEAAVAPLRADSRVTGVETPYDVPAAQRTAMISRNGREAVVNVLLKDDSQTAQDYYDDLRGKVHSDVLSVQGTGDVPLNGAFTDTARSDLRRAELVSLPVTLILLLLIFAGLVAAMLPLGIGALTIVGGLGGTLVLSHSLFVSQYALNIVTLIGLGVSIDYSLFVVSRFRDELAAGASREDALGTTMATAGRSITFSGLTVVIGLAALLFYQGTFLASLGLAGGIVVGVAVLYGLTFLPALLAILGGRVDRLRLPFAGRRWPADRGFWAALATRVMRRPLLVLVPALALLVLAGSPFLGIRLANGTQDNLPPTNEARQGYDTLVRDFPGQDQTTFTVVVDYGAGDPTASANVAQVQDLSQRLGAIPGVLRVAQPQVGRHIVAMDVVSNQPATSDGARSILASIRGQRLDGARLLVSGETAADVDVIDYLVQKTPIALAFVVGVTLLLLFLVTGSVVLPVKAVVMNLLSISASFGALVFIFQQGHLSSLLGFTPQPIDPVIPVLLFAIVFGLSMDYEVLLVTRIQEEYLRTGDNARAVATGLQRTGRLVTGAAAIMVGVFLAFGLADELLIKAIGLGLAIAVALDATVVRGLVVPALMRLMGDLNWWAPGPLARLHRRFAPHLSHEEADTAPAVTAA